jgi:hypothetical protein
MGWKSTVKITREEAIRLIQSRLMDNLSNRELEEMVEGMGFGENPELEYFGHNFIVID